MAERLIPLLDAAGRLGVTPSALRHAIRRGRLAAVKDGRSWYLTPAEIARYRRLTGAPGDGWVTASEAARRLGRSRQRVHQMVAEGALPARRTSAGRVLIRTDALAGVGGLAAVG